MLITLHESVASKKSRQPSLCMLCFFILQGHFCEFLKFYHIIFHMCVHTHAMAYVWRSVASLSSPCEPCGWDLVGLSGLEEVPSITEPDSLPQVCPF